MKTTKAKHVMWHQCCPDSAGTISRERAAKLLRDAKKSGHKIVRSLTGWKIPAQYRYLNTREFLMP